MLKIKTSCAVLAYLSSNLLNEVGLSFFRYFEVGLRVCDIVVKKFMFAISSPDWWVLVFVLQQTNVSYNSFLTNYNTILWLFLTNNAINSYRWAFAGALNLCPSLPPLWKLEGHVHLLRIWLRRLWCVYVYVCLSVCLCMLGTRVTCKRTAEPVEINGKNWPV